VVAGQRAARVHGVQQREAGFGALRHAHRHRPVQLHHRGRIDPAELTVDPGDHRPVSVGRLARAGVAGGDDGLQLVRPGPAGPQRALQDPLSLVDLGPVPAAAVLILQRDQIAAPVGAGGPAGVLQQHQRQQAARLGLARHQPGQRPRQPDRLRAQLRPDHVRARGRAVALVEQQVQHGQDPGGALREQARGRHPVRDRGVADLALGADDPLRHRRLGHQQRAGDLGRGQPGQRPQRERDPRLERQRRMAAGEDEPETVIADAAAVAAGLRQVPARQIGASRLQPGRLAQLGGLVRAAAQHVDRAVTGGGGQPGAGTGGHAVALPRLQGAGERVLRALLGQVPVAGDRDQRGDDLAPLGLEGGADRRLDLRAGVSRHGR
jgi:hypothetical protein